MDGKTFAKLVKDCVNNNNIVKILNFQGLLDKKLTTTDVDLIFAKVKDKAARKITYAQFENSV